MASFTTGSTYVLGDPKIIDTAALGSVYRATSDEAKSRLRISGGTHSGNLSKGNAKQEQERVMALVDYYMCGEDINRPNGGFPLQVYFNAGHGQQRANRDSYHMNVLEPGNVTMVHGIPTTQPEFLEKYIQEKTMEVRAIDLAERKRRSGKIAAKLAKHGIHGLEEEEGGNGNGPTLNQAVKVARTMLKSSPGLARVFFTQVVNGNDEHEDVDSDDNAVESGNDADE